MCVRARVRRVMKCLVYLALVSGQAQSLNLNWSQSWNWSWRDSKGPTAAEDKGEGDCIGGLHDCGFFQNKYVLHSYLKRKCHKNIMVLDTRLSHALWSMKCTLVFLTKV